jgi:hypothetical protein
MNPWTAWYESSYDQHVVDDAGEDDLDALELDAFDRVTFTDEELTEMALDAEPFDPFDPEVERCDGLGPTGFTVIPDWYMPAPGAPQTKTHTVVLIGVVFSLVIITIGGFCVTYGVPDFVWKW